MPGGNPSRPRGPWAAGMEAAAQIAESYDTLDFRFPIYDGLTTAQIIAAAIRARMAEGPARETYGDDEEQD